MKINAYLSFPGNCETAFKFYEKCFRGNIVAMMNHEHPDMAEHVPAAWLSKIMHARLYVGNQVLMGSDTPPEDYKTPEGINVALGVETAEEAERIFGELSDGGQVIMPMDEPFFAIRFGMVRDQFGIPWMVICERQPM